MYSLRAARAALELVGLLDALGAPLLARAPERLLRPDEEEDDRGKDREVDGRAEPVLFIRIRCVLVDNEPLIRAFRDLGPESYEVQDRSAVDVGDVAARDREREHAERDDAVEQPAEAIADLAAVPLARSSSRQSRSSRRASAPWPCLPSERPSSFVSAVEGLREDPDSDSWSGVPAREP